MADTILVVRAIYPDNTTKTRRMRIRGGSHCELRLRFHNGHLSDEAFILAPIRQSAAEASGSDLKSVPRQASTAAD